MLDLASAYRTSSVFEELQGPATAVWTKDHKIGAAVLALFLYKGLFAADRTGDRKRPSASGAEFKAFINRTQTGRA